MIRYTICDIIHPPIPLLVFVCVTDRNHEYQISYSVYVFVCLLFNDQTVFLYKFMFLKDQRICGTHHGSLFRPSTLLRFLPHNTYKPIIILRHPSVIRKNLFLHRISLYSKFCVLNSRWTSYPTHFFSDY